MVVHIVQEVLGRMKRFAVIVVVLIALVLVPDAVRAQSSLTDAQIYSLIEKEVEKGTSREKIVSMLMQRGVTVEQIRRVRETYEKQKNGDIAGGLEVIGSQQKRVREQNGDKRVVGAGVRRRIYSDKKSDEALDEEARNQEIYYSELDFLFPDTMAMYGEYFYEEEEGIEIFGHDIFNNDNLTFESSMNIATPENYMLGPGDEVFVDIYGESSRSDNYTISPEGAIDIEGVGPVSVGGLTVAQATARLRSRLSGYYSGSEIRLTVGQTKTISVQVMGSVEVPGTYTLSAFATVFHALYMAGGVTDIGTLRNVKVFRNNRLLSTVDVYDYILNGKLTGNVRLQDDDVVIVGTYDCLVEITGKVKRPMYYEMKKDESLETLLSYAGGFTGDAYQKTVRLVRRYGERYSVFTVDEFERSTFTMMDGDSVSVDSTLAEFENMVVIKGAVRRPGMYEIGKEVRTVRELLAKAEGLSENAYGQHAVLHRTQDDNTLRTIALNLEGIQEGSVADLALQNKDVIYVIDTEEQTQEMTMSIYGEVLYPGIYNFSENTTVTDLIIQAGGVKDRASLMKVDVSRRMRDKESMHTSTTVAETYTFSFENGLAVEGDSAFTLEPFDEVYIRRAPGYQTQQHVSVSGEVTFEGTYAISEKGMRLSDVIKNCGGLTSDAYAQGARLERQMTAEEKERREIMLSVITSDSVNLSKLELSDTRNVGINLDMAIQHPGSDEWDIVVEDGDRIIVPQYRNTVSVNGEVMYPATLAYRENESLSYYIKHAGGYTDEARTKRVFAVNMNGTVTKVESAEDIQPGCEIVVPSKLHKNTLSMGEILSLGTMTASLASIIVALL